MSLDFVRIEDEVADIVGDLKPAVSSTDGDGYSLSFHVLGRSIPAWMVLGRDFPVELPKIIVDSDALGSQIPHHETSGSICYREAEGLSISMWDPSAVVSQALRHAHGVLTAGLLGTNRLDVVDELEAYWRQHALVEIRTAIDPGDQVKGLKVWVRDEGKLLLSDTKHSRVHLGSLTDGARSVPGGLYIPLSASYFDRRFIDALATGKVGPEQLFALLDADNARLLAARRKRLPGRLSLIIGVGDSNTERVLLGLGVDLVGGGSFSPCPLNVTRVDLRALLPRAGHRASVPVRRVVLVGCGALGGHIATAVARMGVRELTLVDPDTLAEENVYRHVLGFADVGTSKAEALATQIAADIPHVKTHGIVRRVEALPDKILRQAELVIVAIGDATIHRYLNRRLHGERGRMVFGWLEPLGLGGHALLTGAGNPGCLECLFVTSQGGERLNAWCDFAAPDQTFAQRHAGCGGAFTSFSDLDARRTACLVCELVAEVFAHRAAPPILRSWQGKSDAFCESGYMLSEFGVRPLQERELITQSFGQSRCPICARSCLG